MQLIKKKLYTKAEPYHSMIIVVFTRAPGPESEFESGSQSTWERWSEGHHTLGNLVAATNVCLAVALQNWQATIKQLTSNISC